MTQVDGTLAASERELDRRRRAAIDWILRAQQATPDGGVSAYYDTRQGYCETSYPEVTGYIVPTMWDVNRLVKGVAAARAAEEMIGWVTSVQTPSGAATAMDFKTPYVFDTGMDIFGWVRAYRETENRRHLRAAIRAGNWLVDSLTPEGYWTTTPTSGTTHTYHTRVAWALLVLYDVTTKADYEKTARANLDWAVAQQRPNGWFSIPVERETTHFLAYSVRGLLEAGLLLDEPRYIAAAKAAADAVLGRVRLDGFLAGAFDSNWDEAADSCCLTGSLQFAIVWLLLHRFTRDFQYRHAAETTIRFVAERQPLDTDNPGIHGGIAGSDPLDGDYAPYCYLAWAAKFFIDAVNLLLNPDLRLTS